MLNEQVRPINTKGNSESTARNRKRKIALAIVCIVLVIFITVYVLLFTSSQPQQVYQFYSLQERQTVAATKFNEIRNLTIPPAPDTAYTPPAAEVILSEKEVNAIIQTFVDTDAKVQQAMGRIGLQSPSVRLNNNSVDLNARVNYSGIVVPVAINIALLQGQPNTMKMSVMSATIGRMPVGTELRQKLTDAVNSVAPGGQVQLPTGINSIRVESGRLIIIPNPNQPNSAATQSSPLTPPYTYTHP